MKIYINRFISTVAVFIAILVMLVMLVLYLLIAPYYIITGVDLTAKILPKI